MLKTSTAVCLVLMVASAGAAAAADVAIHGTVSQGYLNSSDYNYLTPDTEAGTYSFNEAIVNLSARVDDKTRIGIQLLGRDFGPAGNGNIIVDWAFGDYRWKDQLGFRVGKVKTPLGFYNKTRDVDAVRTEILMPQSVYTEGFRTVATAFQGASVYGSLAVGESNSFDYEAFGGTIEMGSTAFLDYLLDGIVPTAPRLGYTVENEYVAGGQLTWNTPIEGLRVGGSIMSLELDSAGSYSVGAPMPWVIDLDLKVNSLYVLSAEYLWNDLSLAAEYTRWDVDMTLSNIPYPDGSGGLIAVSSDQVDRRGGYYAKGAYRFSPAFEFGAYYSVFHPDWDDRKGDSTTPDHLAWQKDLALTARFDVTDFWLLKLEGHFINGTGDLDEVINPEGFDAESWTMFAAKSTFYF